MSSKVFSGAVKLIMCRILGSVKQGEETKQILCLFIFKGRRLNSTVLETLNLASILNIQVVIINKLFKSRVQLKDQC